VADFGLRAASQGGIMAITDIPILSMLRTRLQWAQERQRVLAENVANADTPRYQAHDLVQPKFDVAGGTASTMASSVTLATTEPGHMNGFGASRPSFPSERAASYEVRPTGNAVNIEDEMMKVAANQMDYQAATAVYVRSLSLIKTALGKK
jgi:flagellar basal-body rod protein FlgB